MRAPSKVVYLIEELALGGGIERVIWTLLEKIPSDRYEIVPWFLSKTGPSFDRLNARFPSARFLNLRTYHRPGPLLSLARELRASGAALVHTHGYFSGTFGRLVAPWLGLPWVYSLYSHYEDTYTARHYLMERLLATTRGTVVACSDVVANFATERCRIPAGKVVVNYEGINVPPETAWPSQRAVRMSFGIPPDAFVLGAVTRFYPGKNVQLLLRAAAGLPDSCHVLLAGSGPEQPALERLARELGLDGRVHFVGLLLDVMPAHLALDLFVQTSHVREGFSIALVEAMAFGRPCAVTAVGGNIEAIDEQTGWISPANDPAALHRAIREAMDDRAVLERKGRAARAKYLARFTGDHMARGMAAVYDRLVR